MDRVHCGACGSDDVPREPDRSFWGLIVAFWAFSLLFGIAAVGLTKGWGFVMALTWVLMATTVSVLAQRATCWTCRNCGAAVPPPMDVVRMDVVRDEQLRHV
jgi:hypothetical protein